MEYLAGAVLVLLGLLIVVFGSAQREVKASHDGGSSRARLPAWLDALLKWTIGIACAWFGGQLLLGHAHYF
jgi:hypothetical protein